jgi:hypothetical protein
MAELVNIVNNGTGIESQIYTEKDDSLIVSNNIFAKYGAENDRIECFIYDLNNNIVDRQYEFRDYIPSPTVDAATGLYEYLKVDPKKDLQSRGFNRGTLTIQYNFLKNLFNSSYGRFYWIKEISTSRKELKITSQNLSNAEILAGYNNYIASSSTLNYYNDFYLNFGSNVHVIAVNVAYGEDADGSFLLVKLYEPLPTDFGIKDQFWIVEKIAEPVSYTVDVQIEAVRVQDQTVLRGPNLNVDINQQVGQTTPYYNYSGLTSTTISSSFQKMMSYYQDKAVQINVDYSDFSNFIHFSSATSRINNFVSKLEKIESTNAQIAQQLAIVGSTGLAPVASTVVNLRNSITDIIENFDTYEYYLYYSSGSMAWPKSNSTQPYNLYSVTSSQAIAWLGSETTVPSAGALSIRYSASLYDATNKDLLNNVVPQYILDDANNEPYVTFVNMIAQHFDNIWLYYKDVSNRYKATNNPNTGVSPDLVADALINLGCTIYTNSNISDNLYYSLFGINEDGSLLPPTGSEHITTYYTSSIATLPANDIQKEIYKRIYHNIPYLYKTKGTRESINALVNIFGIPKTVLTINEFGGYNRNVVVGIDNIDNIRITGSSNVLEISSSLLNPYTTLQYYDNVDRVNSKNLEFGFSTSDVLNTAITASYFDIDQLIGDPGYQYSSSYAPLDIKRYNFFSGYNYYHNIYEYIRLLKYFDNSIFKMVKDFVPARANLSSGLIVKSHILERNKYERHEPEMDNSMNYTQSIETISISATDAPEIPYSTAYNTTTQYTVVSPYIATGSDNVYGPVAVSNNYSWEKYTGEFGGTTLNVTDGYMSQLERSSITAPWTSSVATTQSMFTFYDEGALVNNITNTAPSKEFVSAEYSYGIDTPINFSNIASQSACDSCYRLHCFTYVLSNSDTSEANYSYLDCRNAYYALTVPATSSLAVCAKPGTLLTSSTITATIGEVCGTTRSSSPYGTCINTTVTNYSTTSTLDIVWTNCNGSLGSSSLSTGPVESLQQCVRRGTMTVAPLALAPTYSITEYNECGVYSTSPSCFIYTGSWSPTGGGETGSYRDCYTGETRIQIFPDGGSTLMRVPCAQSGSFRVYGNGGDTVPFLTLTSKSCAYAGEVIPDPLNPRCTYLTSLTAGVGYYSYSYRKCSGELVSVSGSDLAASYVVNDCIRLNTLITSNIDTIFTGSYCGYYADLAEYTGSRQYAEVQDYNYHRTSAVHSKYAGAKYTNENSSERWEFGATVNPRDYYVDYTGLFTTVETSSYFPNELVLKVPYLANVSGGLQELNLQNENWVYFQNIYKQGSMVTLKQFNSTQYSNQKTLDKSFKVIESGYSYQPYYYRSSASLSECFDTDISEAYSISGSSYVKKQYYGYSLLYNGGAYTAGVGGVSSNFPMAPFSGSDNPIGTTGPASGLWEVNIWTSGSYYDIPGNNAAYFGNKSMLSYYVSGTIPSFSEFGAGYYTGGGRFKAGEYYTVPFDGFYNLSAVFVIVKEDIISPYNISGSFTLDLINGGTGTTSSIMSSGFVDGTLLATETINITASYTNYYDPGKELSIQTTEYLTSGSKIFFRLKTDYRASSYVVGSSQGFYIEPGANMIFSAVSLDATLCRSLTIADNDLFNAPLTTTSSLTLMKSINNFFNSGSTFNPGYADYYNSSSALYDSYGDINYTMQPDYGDYIYLYFDGLGLGFPGSVVGTTRNLRYMITNIDTDPSSNTKRLHVTPELPPYLNSGSINNYTKVVFAKRVPDETTMILEGRKNPGKTSYGFVIPENINPKIVKNANTLQSTIQSQILNY